VAGKPDYPLEALREAVVNAVVHRDYSLIGESIRIFYYLDHIEIHNHGLLLPGISLADLQQGRVGSKLRNRIIGTVLRDFPGGYIERVGSGISYMIEQMRKLGRPDPRFEEQGEIVVTFLRALEYDAATISSAPAGLSSTPPSIAGNAATTSGPPIRADSTIEERQQLALSYVHTYGSISNKQYRTLTGISETTALGDLDVLVARGSLRAIGKRRSRQSKLP
jgi:ATP-dependent DNA helicase RecG